MYVSARSHIAAERVNRPWNLAPTLLHNGDMNSTTTQAKPYCPPQVLLSVGRPLVDEAWRRWTRPVDGIQVEGRHIPRGPCDHGPVRAWHLPSILDATATSREIWRIHRAWRVRLFVVHPRRGEAAPRRTEAFLAEIGLATAELPVWISVEVMNRKDYPSPSQLAASVHWLRARHRLVRLGVCLNTSHVLPPQELESVLDELDDTIGHVHLSDVEPGLGPGHFRNHAFLGDGVIDWSMVLPAIRARYQGPLVLEFDLLGREGAADGVQRSVRLVRRLLDPVYAAYLEAQQPRDEEEC